MKIYEDFFCIYFEHKTPHDFVYLDLIEKNGDDAAVQTVHREICSNVLGTEMPYNYDWMEPVPTNYQMISRQNRGKLREIVPNYHQHYQHRGDHKH